MAVLRPLLALSFFIALVTANEEHQTPASAEPPCIQCGTVPSFLKPKKIVESLENYCKSFAFKNLDLVEKVLIACGIPIQNPVPEITKNAVIKMHSSFIALFVSSCGGKINQADYNECLRKVKLAMVGCGIPSFIYDILAPVTLKMYLKLCKEIYKDECKICNPGSKGHREALAACKQRCCPILTKIICGLGLDGKCGAHCALDYLTLLICETLRCLCSLKMEAGA